MKGKNNPNYKHGHSSKGKQSPTYNSWVAMIKRCYNENHEKYHTYGGRGITVEKRFHEFINFLEYMGKRPKNTSLDRINSNGNYKTGNMRWSTVDIQTRNRGGERNSTSKYKGVHLVKDRNKWRASIRVNYKLIHLGYFISEKKAAQAYNDAAIEHWGSDCFLNKL